MNDKLKFLIDTLNESEQHAVYTIIQSLEIAKKKHPKFANDSLLYCASIVAEEAGEFCRAINQQVYENGNSIDSGVEASQIGAVAIRALCMLSKQAADTPFKYMGTEELMEYMDDKVLEIKKETGIVEISLTAIREHNISFSEGLKTNSFTSYIKWASYLEETAMLLRKTVQYGKIETTL